MKHHQFISLSMGVALLALPLVTFAMVSTTIDSTLRYGMSGESVRLLQTILNKTPETRVALSGDGSPGNETTYFGKATFNALKKYQELHASEVLTPAGLTEGTGIVGVRTRELLNRGLSGGDTAVATVPTEANFKALQDRIDKATAAFNTRLNTAMSQSQEKATAASETINSTTKTLQSINATIARMQHLSDTINVDGTVNPDAANGTLAVDLVVPPVPLPGSQIRVFGSGFLSTNTIHIGNFTAIFPAVATSSVILTGSIPADIPAGVYDFYVENTNGKSAIIPITIGGNIVALPLGSKPVISSIQPASGSLSSRIVLTGSNFASKNIVITTVGALYDVPSSDGRTMSFALSDIDKRNAPVNTAIPGSTLRMIVRTENGVSNVAEYMIQ